MWPAAFPGIRGAVVLLVRCQAPVVPLPPVFPVLVSVLPVVRSRVPVFPVLGSCTPVFPVLGSGTPVIPAEFPLPGRGAAELFVEIIFLAEQRAGGSVGRAGIVFPGIIFPGILAPVLVLGVVVREPPVVVEALVVAGPGQRPGVTWGNKTRKTFRG